MSNQINCGDGLIGVNVLILTALAWNTFPCSFNRCLFFRSSIFYSDEASTLFIDVVHLQKEPALKLQHRTWKQKAEIHTLFRSLIIKRFNRLDQMRRRSRRRKEIRVKKQVLRRLDALQFITFGKINIHLFFVFFKQWIFI